MMVGVKLGQTVDRDQVLAKLVDIQYERNDFEFQPGKFRVRGDCVEIWPSYEEFAFRIEFWGDEVEQLSIINPISGEAIERPATRISPEVGRSMPPTRWSSVDLPLPDSPTRARDSPAATSRSRLSRATTGSAPG
jgi:excinuclease UvrABC helicase subunit UvrB